jgi:hypothetical protein
MRNIILFSSIFYLIGLKIGSTIEGFKNALIPSKSIITAPLKKSEKPEKSYHFKAEDDESKSAKEQTEPAKEIGSAKQPAAND